MGFTKIQTQDRPSSRNVEAAVKQEAAAYGSGSQPATPEPTVTLNRGKKGGFGACSYETYFGLNPSGQGVAFSGGLQLV